MRLTTTYTCNDFNRIIDSLISHLTLPEPSIPTEFAFNPILKRLQIREPGYGYRFKIDNAHVDDYASDFEIGPENDYDKHFDFCIDRYAMPLSIGANSCYELRLVGKKVDGEGNNDIVAQLDYSAALREGDHLGYLKDLYNHEQDSVAEVVSDKLINDGRSCIKNGYHEEAQFIASLGGVAIGTAIQTEEARLNYVCFSSAISMIRFYNDFFGKAIELGGAARVDTTFRGPCNIELAIPNNIESIITRPNRQRDELIRVIFP